MRRINRVAVMGGSGKDYISAAVSSGADVFVTGDLGHHDFLEYCSSILLVDATHRATELPVLSTIKERLHSSPLLEGLEIIIDWGNTVQTAYEYNGKGI